MLQKKLKASLFALAIFSIGFSGCVPKANVGLMVSQQKFLDSSSYSNSVNVGDIDSEELTVGKENFKQALVLSLKSSGFYNPNGEYKLDVTIINFKQFGIFLPKLVATIQYEIINKNTHEKLFKKIIVSSTKLYFADNSYRERLVKENLTKFLKLLSSQEAIPSQSMNIQIQDGEIYY